MSLTYATHKDKYEYEIVITIKKHRNALAKLRMSNHDLKIHTGRHTRPKSPRENRFCESCRIAVVHEAHLLFDCKIDSQIKEEFFNNFVVSYPDFAELLFNNCNSNDSKSD